MDLSKPRIAVFYGVYASTGWRNDGGPLYSTFNLRKILDGKNFKMDSPDSNVLRFNPWGDINKFGKFDLHLWVDHGEDAIGVPLDWHPPSPNAYWVSDAHVNAEAYKYRLEKARHFDYVFCCQKKFITQFLEDGIPQEKLFYLPHAVEPDCYRPFPIVEKYDWAFIGHLSHQFRVDLLDAMAKAIPNWYMGWRLLGNNSHNVFDDVARKFCQSKVIVSNSINQDVQMRTYESLACKRALVTQSVPDLEDLFQNGKHLMTYNTIDEAIDDVRFLLENDDYRNQIAQKGYDEVIAKHTYRHRMLDILKTTINYEPDQVPQEELINATH